MRVAGQAKVRVEDDAEEGSAAREAGAVGERGIVGKNGADAGEDGVRAMTELLDLFAGCGAREPDWRGFGASAGRWREIAVGGQSGFEGDERAVLGDEAGEGVVELAGRLLKKADVDLDAGDAEAGDALAGDEGVWVDSGDDHASNAGGDKGVGARWGAAVVRARLEGDVGGSPGSGVAEIAGLLESDNFGVVAVSVEVRTLADDLSRLPV